MNRLRQTWRQFLRDEEGAVVVDFIPVFLALTVIVLMIFEIAISYYVLLGAEKAAKLGARVAATVEAVHGDVPQVNEVNYFFGRQGDFCYQPTGPDACTDPGGPWICDGSSLDGACNEDAFNRIIRDMRRTFPRLEADGVTISYAYRRLGIVGGPFVPEIEVSIEPESFRFLTLILGSVTGSLIEKDAAELARVTASSFGEDLSSGG
ncbi:MAG: hypothetical protein AAFV19_21095 [Pseudomonadota bacterium]